VAATRGTQAGMAVRKLKPSRTGSGAVAFWSIEEKAKALSEKTIIQVVKESPFSFLFDSAAVGWKQCFP
jgi:hypothetical protein